MGSAEMSAQLRALLWVMQSWYELQQPDIVMMYDSCNAASIAQALADPKVHSRLAKLLAGTLLCLREHASASYHHVKSHDGHPWNELADVGATLLQMAGTAHNCRDL